MTWRERLLDDPLPWLLAEDTPAVRAAALQRLAGRAADDPEVAAAREAAMAVDPIRAILAAQDAEGWWVKPGPGYAPKYRGTVWSVMFLDQLGADPAHPAVARGVDYVLDHTVVPSGGFGASGSEKVPPPPSAVIHCLNGNLVRACIGLGRGGDERVRAAVDWAARAITGEGVDRWYASGTSGPGFACDANGKNPCAWGALKELAALARVPAAERSPAVRRAVDAGVAFLFSRDPLAADYPTAPYDTQPSAVWWRPGFPLAYVSDVLQTLEVLAELGHIGDPRLAPALDWLASLQDAHGRWPNRHAYHGKLWVDVDRQGKPSKWVTLRACAVLRAADG